MFVYAWRMIRRIGVGRVAIAGVLVVLAIGGGVYLIRHKTPQQKMDAAEAAYDQAMAAGAFGPASGLMRSALAVNENEPRFWLKLGRSEIAGQNYQGALEAFSRVLDYDPDNIEALQAVSELSVAGGNFDDAKDYVGHLLKLQPGDVRGSIVQVALATRERRFDDADRLIAGLKARGVNTDDLYLLQSRARMAHRDLAGAIAILEARDKATPNSLPVLRELVTLYQNSGNQAGLRRTYARLLALDPTNVTFQLAAAETTRREGRVDEARETVSRIQSSAPNDPNVQLPVIAWWLNADGREAALTAARWAGANGGPATKIAVAQKMVDLGAAADGLALVRQVTGQFGAGLNSGAVSALTVEGNALYALGRLDEAEKIADRLLAYDQTNNPALMLGTRVKIARKLPDDALTYAQLLTQNQLDSLEPLLLLGQVYAMRHEWALADVTYARARAAFPNSTRAVREGVAFFMSRGRTKDAVAIVDDFVKSHFLSPQTRPMLVQICRDTPLPGCRKPPA